jgi:hypothetical protein
VREREREREREIDIDLREFTAFGRVKSFCGAGSRYYILKGEYRWACRHMRGIQGRTVIDSAKKRNCKKSLPYWRHGSSTRL